jgi:hypothetical protein
MGAPFGNHNAAKARRWHDALNRALARYTSKEPPINAGEALDTLALNVVASALAGDWEAITEIGNRLDGKPAQALTLGGDHENPLEVLQKIERVLVHAHTKD